MHVFVKKLWNFKWVLCVYLALFIVLIPVFKLCNECIPNADDFTYGYKAHQAYRETGSFWPALIAAFHKTKEIYQTWQGSYSSVFLMSIHPGVFSLGLYRAAAVVLIMLTIMCPAFLAIVISKYLLNGRLKFMLCLSAVYALVSLQFMPSIFEGIYWFNGAWYYTFSFDMVLLWLACLIVFDKSRTKWKRWTAYALSTILVIFLGGTNYPQVLLLSLAFSAYILLVFIRRNQNRWYFCALWILLGICISINVFAPGNIANGSIQTHANLRYTFLFMLKHAFVDLSGSSVTYLTLFVCCLMIPFGKKLVIDSKIKFLNPILMVTVTVLLYFAMYTPAAFIHCNGGPLRAQNVRCMVLQFFIYANVINIFGYMKNTKKETPSVNPALCLIMSIFILAVGAGNQRLMDAWSIKSQYSIMGLEVRDFGRSMKEFFNELEDPDVRITVARKLPTNEMLLPSIDRLKHFGLPAYYDKEEVRFD